MVTLLTSTAPRRIARHEAMGPIATLRQASRAVYKGDVGPPLDDRAASTAQRLLALVQAMARDAGTRLAHAITGLVQTVTPFGLLQARRLSELLTTFRRGLAQVSARQPPRQERVACGIAPLLAVGLGTLSWMAAVVLMAALLGGGLLLLHACVHWYGPQEGSPSMDSAPMGPAALAEDDGPSRARNPARG